MEFSKFFVQSGSQEFKSRQKDVFAALSVCEEAVKLPKNDAQPMEVDESPSRHRAKKSRRTTKVLRGQESLFKVPGLPPIRTNMPDFRRNPGRWTKYTLADVNASDLTEASNTAAAMDFLRSRHQATPLAIEDIPTKIKFSKSGQRRSERVRTEESDDDREIVEKSPLPKTSAFGEPSEPIESPPPDKAAYVRNKLVMPEYVVGQKIAKPKKVRSAKPKGGKELSLSHLTEDE